VTLWVTFAPCFLWIFVGAPYIEWMSSRPRLTGALSGITAAVVGVILNLSLWFALHVMFGEVTEATPGPARLAVPVVATLLPGALVLTVLAAGLLLWRKMDLLVVLPIMALAALLWQFAGGGV